MSEALPGILPRLHANESQAFEEFIAHWSRAFERFLRNKGFTPADAYDVGLSCATHAAMQVGRFPGGPEKFDAWVWKVGRNFANDWRKKNLRAPMDALDEMPPERWVPDREEACPDGANVVALRAAVARLAPEDRRLIEMHDLKGSAPFAEVAKELGISEGNARVRRHRILKEIARLMRDGQS